MTEKISELDAEKLSETPISEDDATFLRRFYAQRRLLAGESVLDKLSSPSVPNAEIITQYRELMSKIRPDLVDRIDDAKVVAAYREHENGSSEILGDFPRKLKKWTIFVLSDYASTLAAKVFFAAFRLDELNACAIKLPSGAVAVVINVSFLGIVPVLYSAFLDIYDTGASTKGIFEVQSSESTKAILQMAKLFARKDFEALPNVTKRLQIRTDALEKSFRVSILAALHECAHVVLGHLYITSEIQRRVNGISADSWQYAQALEYEADSFAVKQFLYVEQRVPQEWAFDIAIACSILFGFAHLVSEYSKNSGPSHPESTYRWTNVRSELVSAMGSEIVVKRLEGIIEALTTMRQFDRTE